MLEVALVLLLQLEGGEVGGGDGGVGVGGGGFGLMVLDFVEMRARMEVRFLMGAIVFVCMFCSVVVAEMERWILLVALKVRDVEVCRGLALDLTSPYPRREMARKVQIS